jgi:hypothetical protein
MARCQMPGVVLENVVWWRGMSVGILTASLMCWPGQSDRVSMSQHVKPGRFDSVIFAWDYVDMEDFASWVYLYIKTRLHQSDCHTDLVVFG